MNRRKSAILAIALSLGLVLGACGDDSSPSANDDEAGETDQGGEGGFTVKLTAEGLELPDEVEGGIVEVTLETELDEPEVNFSKVPAGTSEADLRAAIASATSGGEIPALIEATNGVGTFAGDGSITQTIQLPEGDYFAWADPVTPEGEGEEAEGEGEEPTETTAAEAAEGEEGEGGEEDAPNPDAFLVKPLKVTAGADGELPDTGSTITARDYSFDVNVKAGSEQFTFQNEGPDQLHHAILMNFGKIPAADVEANLQKFLESEGEGEPPAAFKDLDMEKVFSTGGSAVVSPGLAGTANAKFESGTTYAAICFLQDRTGGPPHVFGKGMRTVFTVE